MKTFLLGVMAVTAWMLFDPNAQAQYKRPRDYFPKTFPAPPAGGAKPAAPKTPDKPEPAKPQQRKFKDLSTNSQFYFLSDTNRTYVWTKLSTTKAKNTKNGVIQAISGETPIQK